MDTANDARPVNNAIYDTLGDRWYSADDDPVALLRAESRLRNPWVAAQIQTRAGARSRVLDIGCGAGFLANALAREGHTVTGIDVSEQSLAIGGRHDDTRTVRYERGDALALPYATASFDVVCAMDFLEHVEDPAAVVAEAARVLRPGGLFFFHTFNRNPLAWLIVIKGVEWFVKNTPPDMHVLRLFVKPAELRAMCAERGLDVCELHGTAPAVFSRAFWAMLATGHVGPDFRFEFTRWPLLAYTGLAERR
jgi:2-polyprenyl-6-hydroxyphenyl methylase/3-demethylubiquinone-9 3-methyltransferase